MTVGDNFATCCDVDGFSVLTGHRGFNNEGCDVKLWDLRKIQEVRSMKDHQQSVEAVKIFKEHFVSCGKDGKLVLYEIDGQVKETWEHPTRKPFVKMDSYKDGLLAANIEPKVMFFSIFPLLNEF